jgi:hypothetical protein
MRGPGMDRFVLSLLKRAVVTVTFHGQGLLSAGEEWRAVNRMNYDLNGYP